MLDRLLTSSFYAPMGAFLRDLPFSHWSDDDVTPLPANAPPPPSESTYHNRSRQAVILHMCYMFGWITALPSSFSYGSRRENICRVLSSFSLCISYALVHASQVGNRGVRYIIFCSLLSPRHRTHCANKSFSVLLQMVDWTFERPLADIQSPPSIPFYYPVEPRRSPSGGHSFC